MNQLQKALTLSKNRGLITNLSDQVLMTHVVIVTSAPEVQVRVIVTSPTFVMTTTLSITTEVQQINTAANHFSIGEPSPSHFHVKRSWGGSICTPVEGSPPKRACLSECAESKALTLLF